jgi:hypothetical protein
LPGNCRVIARQTLEAVARLFDRNDPTWLLVDVAVMRADWS